VSVAMITAGVCHLRRNANGHVVRLRARNWLGIVVGAAIIFVSFTLDYRNIMAGGMPHAFNWPVFGLGMIVASFGYLNGAVESRGVRTRTTAA
jgi:hypothetical protein